MSFLFRKNTLFLISAIALSLTACQPSAKTDTTTEKTTQSSGSQSVTATVETATNGVVGTATAAQIMARPEVPVLCYHQIRDWRGSDSQSAKDIIVPVARFREQMQMLADSGYHTILPDQLLAYLTSGAALPTKPIMLTFDDTDLDQYTIGAPEMEKHGFKGVFFIMTVSIGHHGRQPYMDKAQIKALADRGHVIASHTWDHHRVDRYAGKDWDVQITEPTAKLEAITGKNVRYFAYPFGLWNAAAIPELKKRGMVAAFQLGTKRDPAEPLHTIRRIIGSGYWSAKSLHANMVESFKNNK